MSKWTIYNEYTIFGAGKIHEHVSLFGSRLLVCGERLEIRQYTMSTVNDKSPCHHLNDTVPRSCESVVWCAVSDVTLLAPCPGDLGCLTAHVGTSELLERLHS